MIELGKKQTLEVVKKVEFGVYLAEEAGSTDKVLLPKKQVPEGTENGSKIEVLSIEIPKTVSLLPQQCRRSR